MHKGCQNNHQMYMHTEETLRIKIELENTAVSNFISPTWTELGCEEDPTASIN
jgi:hypothetical protein